MNKPQILRTVTAAAAATAVVMGSAAATADTLGTGSAGSSTGSAGSSTGSAGSSTGSAGSSTGSAGQATAPDHIFYIMMENHGYSQIIGNTADAPYINQLATANLATNFHGVTHPSLPNYLTAFSGDFQGIWDDCAPGANITCAPEEFVPNSGDGTDKASLTADQIASATAKPHLFDGKNLVDQLEGAGKSWKAYMQAMPSAGFLDAKDPTSMYAAKHNPFVYFSDITSNPARLAKVVPAEGNLDQDLASGNVANFTWLSPDVCHDMHGASTAVATAAGYPDCAYPASGLDHSEIAMGDAYLKDTIGKIQASPAWKKGHNSIVVAWDENDYSGYSGGPGSPVGANGAILGGGDAPLLVLNSVDGQAGFPGHQVPTVSDHYSVLATIEKLWNLGCLANTCSPATSGSLDEMFVK